MLLVYPRSELEKHRVGLAGSVARSFERVGHQSPTAS
jgi:hypothetical protein